MNRTADVSMRLDRLLTMLALGSRAQVRDLIKSGRVSVSGKAVKSADHRVEKGDEIQIDGAVLDARTIRHVMLNKPCGILTAARDAKQPTVLDLFPPSYAACGCMPVGRLDKDTEGLLLLTTDGTLAHMLLSPKRHVWKCYLAEVEGRLQETDVEAFAQGMELSDFTALPAKLEILQAEAEKSTAKVWVQEGKYHQVRRMLASRGHPVTKLKRLSVGPLTLDESLMPGEFRELTSDEIQALINAVSGEEKP